MYPKIENRTCPLPSEHGITAIHLKYNGLSPNWVRFCELIFSREQLKLGSFHQIAPASSRYFPEPSLTLGVP